LAAAKILRTYIGTGVLPPAILQLLLILLEHLWFVTNPMAIKS